MGWTNGNLLIFSPAVYCIFNLYDSTKEDFRRQLGRIPVSFMGIEREANF